MPPGVDQLCRHCAILRLCRPDLIAAKEPGPIPQIPRRFRKLRRSAHLFEAGDSLHSISAICGGSVKTYASIASGRKQVAGLHLPGELIGLGGLPGRKHRVSAIALEQVTVCEIDLAALDELGKGRPSLQRELMAIVAAEVLHEHETKMSLLGKKTADERLAAHLVHISRRYAKRGSSPDEFSLTMSRSDIGNYLGLAKETVSRMFSRFEEDGVLTVRAKHVRINDLSALTQLACADTLS